MNMSGPPPESSTTCLLMLIGLPGCGKTTFCSLYKDHIKRSEKEFDLIHVCYDDLIPLERQAKISEGEGSWKKERENIVMAVEALVVGDTDTEDMLHYDKLVDQLSENKSRKQVIVIDDNNYLSSMRQTYYQMAKRHNLGFCQLYFQVPLDAALTNNENRPSSTRVPDIVIEKMDSKMESPQPLANRWEQFSFSLASSNSINFDIVDNVVETAFNHPVEVPDDNSEQRDVDRVACSASLIHQVDKVMRGLVGMRLKGIENKDKVRSESGRLSSVKSELMEDLKTGFTKIDRTVVEKVESRDKSGIECLSKEVEILFESKLVLSSPSSS